jgi:N utilization substance protein A
LDESLAERLVGEGFLTYDELSVIEPDALMTMGSLTEEQVQHIVDQAEQKAEEAEVAAAAERRRQREQERIEAATVEADKQEADLSRDEPSVGGEKSESPSAELAESPEASTETDSVSQAEA